MMRISTLQMFTTNLDSMLTTQSKINDTREQVSTGKKFIRDSQNPVVANQLKALNNTQAQLQTFQGNVIAAKNQLSLEETNLSNFNTIVTNVTQLSLSALNGGLNSNNRVSIATQLQNHLDELVNIANTQDADGNYVFSGAQLKTKPFINSGGTITYHGDNTQRFLSIQSSTSVAISDSGNELFSSKNSFVATPAAANTGTGIMSPVTLDNIYTPNTYTISFAVAAGATTYSVTDGQNNIVVPAGTAYTDGEAINFNGMQVTVTGAPAAGDTYTVNKAGNIFNAMQNMITALRSNPTGASGLAQFTSTMNNNIAALDNGAVTLLNKLTDVGSRLNTVSSTENVLQGLTLQNGKTISTLGEADLVETVSLLSQQTTTLQAIQKVYVATNNLSLFQFI